MEKRTFKDSEADETADPLLGIGPAPSSQRLDAFSRTAVLALGLAGVVAILGCLCVLWMRPAAHCEPPLASSASVLGTVEEPSHHTVYLVIGADGSAISDHHVLLSDRTDMIALCWRRECEKDYAGDVKHPGLEFVYYPKSTWTEGRNRLLRVAQERERLLNRPYVYYTFLDNDFRPSWDPSFPSIAAYLAESPDRVGSPRAMWDYYEARLLEYRPALATPNSIWHAATPHAREEVSMIRYLDARVNSFHRATLDDRRLLLPYSSDWDDESWWASQAVLLWRSQCLYGAVMQVNGIADAEMTGSPLSHGNEHASYPRGDPFPLVASRIDEIVPPMISAMVPPNAGFSAGRLAPYFPRRADWLSTVPAECWTTGQTLKFGGYDL